MINHKNMVSIILAVVLVLLLFLVKDTWRGYLIESLGGYTGKEQTIKVDTLEPIIDTVYLPSKKEYIPVPIAVPEIKYKDTIVYRESEPIHIKDTVLTYNNPIKDSNIIGNIKTIVTTNGGFMIGQVLDYELRNNYVIKETLPISTTIETVVKKGERNKLGIGATISNINTIGVGGIYQTKNNLQFQLNYSILGNKNNIQIGNNEYNSVISIGIYKLF